MRPTRAAAALAGLLVALLVATGCSVVGASSGTPERAVDDCGPPSYGEIRGPRPAYAGRRLSRFPGDTALCAGRWLPGSNAGFVAQGLAVGPRAAWVVGYDGTRPEGHRTCIVQRVALGTGRLLRRSRTVRKGGATCHHGGGLARTPEGLWLVETHRLWLLQPRTLRVRRTWSVPAPVRGSFLVSGTSDRLGIGSWKDGRRGRLYWFELPRVRSRSSLTAGVASSSRPIPANVQGAYLGVLGGVDGLWFSRSSTRCGILDGPGGQRAFLPGAEGLVVRNGSLWVVSESASRRYFTLGDRPLVPMLARFSPAVADGPAPTCAP